MPISHDDFLEEQIAAKASGLSIRTLQRFAETGYFQIRVNPDGSRLYPRVDLERTLGASLVLPSETLGVQSESQAIPPSRIEKTVEVNLSSVPNPATTISQTTEVPSAQPEIAQEDKVPPQASPTVETFFRASLESTPSVPDRSAEMASRLYLLQLERKTQQLEEEVSRQKSVNAMHDKLLDLKDREIEDLRSQRDWLKVRIQGLEDQSNRFQVLMLNEMQMTSKLVKNQLERRSGLTRALTWLGIGHTEQDEHK